MKLLTSIKLIAVLAPAFCILGFASPAHASPVDDGDGVPASIEDSSVPNAGDNNYDGVQDSVQNPVATLQNPNDTQSPDSWVTLEVGNPGDNEGSPTPPWQITEFAPVAPADVPTAPDGKVFPLGLFKIKLVCDIESQYQDTSCSRVCGEGSLPQLLTDSAMFQSDAISQECDFNSTADLRLLFDRVMDTSNWTMLKYNESTSTYVDYSAYTTVSTQNIGFLRTVIDWSVTDNGFGDDNANLNEITDPAGPAVPTQVALANPIVTAASVVRSETLANTGLNSQIIILVGALLVISGLALAPKKI